MRRIATGSDAFEQAIQQVKHTPIRPEFRIDEVPAPQRLAPSAIAITAERIDLDDDTAYGRFVLLHDPDGVDEWEGCFRAVVFVRAAVESELLSDPLMQEVAWSWLIEALTSAGADAVQVGGTVTVTSGVSFGSMSERPSDGFVEIRASWTPVGADSASEADMTAHVTAWIDLLAHATGLAPLPAGVAHVGARRGRRLAER